VNYPLQYFAERIGGDLVEVYFPAPADVDPAFWKPDVADITAYQQADLILLNGATYAKWVTKVSLPESKLVTTTAAVTDKYITVADAVTHQHGRDGEHSHDGVAFTTWLDPRIAIEQARATKNALQRLLPDNVPLFDANFTRLEQDLMDLDRSIEQIVSADPDRPLFASHPIYQYFAARYGLNLKSVHWEPDQEPDEDAWERFQQLQQEHAAQSMLWESAPIKMTAAKLEELGIKSVVYSPCANAPDAGDFFTVMQQNVKNLQAFWSHKE